MMTLDTVKHTQIMMSWCDIYSNTELQYLDAFITTDAGFFYSSSLYETF